MVQFHFHRHSGTTGRRNRATAMPNRAGERRATCQRQREGGVGQERERAIAQFKDDVLDQRCRQFEVSRQADFIGDAIEQTGGGTEHRSAESTVNRPIAENGAREAREQVDAAPRRGHGVPGTLECIDRLLRRRGITDARQRQ